MARIAYVNGRYMQQAEAGVHIEDRGYQFADGVYEYIAFYNRTLLDGALHMRRLWRSLRALEIAAPMSEAALNIVIRELIERNGRINGGIYIQVTRGVARRDHPFPKQKVKPAIVITICAAKLPKDAEVKGGTKVITHPDIRWGRRDIKSVSLLPNILAKQEAAKSGAREAWLLDGQIVTEGAASNAYIVTRAGEILTHPANEFILSGITRDVVLALARKDGISVAERAFAMSDVRQAAEAFLTSTSANVLPVVKVDGLKIGEGKPGPVTRTLQALYNAHILKQTGKTL